jgi:DNA-binding MarR family transcriptional regulator
MTTPSQRPGMALKQAEQAMVAALARASLVTPQAMMVVLTALDEQGLVVRLPHPRHPSVLELHLTDAGAEALPAARPLADPLERRVLASFPAAELGVLGALLTRWADAFEEARPDRP